MVNTSGMYLARQRFSASHELAHFLFDRGREALHIDETLSAARTPEEQRANAFAVNLILPAELIRARAGDPDFDLANDESIVGLAMEYGLSVTSLAWHLKNHCNISTARREEIAALQPMRIANSMGLVDRVAQESRAKDAYGYPRRYLRLLTRAWEHQRIDDQQLVALLGEDRDLIDKVMNPPLDI